MNSKLEMLPFVGLLAVMGIAIGILIHADSQAPGNFTNAAVAEVRNAQGAVVLQGPFVAGEEDDDDIERKATLKPTGIDADASGEAEVEFARSAPSTQEIEFSVRGLQPGAAFAFVIDGQEVATATADRNGKAEVEIDVRMPGSPQSH